MENEPITADDNTVIFRPSEFEMLLKGAKKPEHKINLRTCLFLGARYLELVEIQKNPEWFDGNFIRLPQGTEKKVKRHWRKRTIHLNPMGKQILEQFFDNRRLPTRKNWNDDLKRWCNRGGFDPIGYNEDGSVKWSVRPKSTRKTIESWLMAIYPERSLEICLSQGHTQTTSLQHYMNLGFDEVDKIKIRSYVEGWG